MKKGHITYSGTAYFTARVPVNVQEMYEDWFDISADDRDDFDKFCEWVAEYYEDDIDTYIEITDFRQLDVDWDESMFPKAEWEERVDKWRKPPHVRGQMDFYGNVVDQRGRKID